MHVVPKMFWNALSCGTVDKGTKPASISQVALPFVRFQYLRLLQHHGARHFLVSRHPLVERSTLQAVFTKVEQKKFFTSGLSLLRCGGNVADNPRCTQAIPNVAL
jgi:hypothetical protein